MIMTNYEKHFMRLSIGGLFHTVNECLKQCGTNVIIFNRRNEDYATYIYNNVIELIQLYIIKIIQSDDDKIAYSIRNELSKLVAVHKPKSLNIVECINNIMSEFSIN